MTYTGIASGRTQAGESARDWAVTAFKRLVGVSPDDLSSYEGRVGTLVEKALGRPGVSEELQQGNATQIAVARMARVLIEQAREALAALHPLKLKEDADQEMFDDISAVVRSQIDDLDFELQQGPQKDVAVNILKSLLGEAREGTGLQDLRDAGGFDERNVDTASDEETLALFTLISVDLAAIRGVVEVLGEQPGVQAKLLQFERHLRCITSLAAVARQRFAAPGIPAECITIELGKLDEQGREELAQLLEDFERRSPRWVAEVERGGRRAVGPVIGQINLASQKLRALLSRAQTGEKDTPDEAYEPAPTLENCDAELWNLLRQALGHIDAASDVANSLVNESGDGGEPEGNGNEKQSAA